MLEGIKPVLRIQKDLFRIPPSLEFSEYRIQLRIFRVPDTGKSFGSMRIRIQSLSILFKYIWKLCKHLKFN